MTSAQQHAFVWQIAVSVLLGQGRVYEHISEKLKRRNCLLDPNSSLLPSSRVDNLLRDPAALSVRSNVVISGQLLVFANGGHIEIGDDFSVAEGMRNSSASSIKFGSRALISHALNIHDINSHSTSSAIQHTHITAIRIAGHVACLHDVADAPVSIDDDVWTCFHAVILKGIRIGRGAIIGAAELIYKFVAPYSIMVGNPARLVGS